VFVFRELVFGLFALLLVVTAGGEMLVTFAGIAGLALVSEFVT